ncbi:hypothetical protein [Dolichospermum heterosporum]|uniref:HEPN domain-containing protein n=1 Tax=Dolichospermum heterosporum TAC447 TaxID=747523 RepID=A0ABY5M1P0_9CYAN|nr:hypothetical protein [Dolichospermum heterosporum]UUO16800.1 hypothetical protein NG743_07200 [Dolichospermum heterosporum TAC447]
MAIPFTDKEMKKAWGGNLSASQISPRTNAHRLLLFYAVECGLKAVLMARQETRRTNLCKDIKECGHNINKLLSLLGAGGSLSLPTEIFIQEILDTRNNKEERKLNPGQMNELWRYGGKVTAINKDGKIKANDEDIENKLLEISKWIAGEIERL